MSDERDSNSDWDHSRWDKTGSDKAGWDKSAWADAARESQEQDDPGPRPADRSGGAGSDQRRSTRPGQERRKSRPRPPAPRAEMLSDFQRWLLRSSAKSMRKEISGQVRRTLGSGRSERADVWDTATSEIPPEVGESPECQWCPICRAARRMRESGPGLGDHLSTAGDMVSAAVSEALKSVDSVLSRTSGAGSRPAPPDDWAPGTEGWDAARDSWAAAHGAIVGADSADSADGEPAAAGPGHQAAAAGPGDQAAAAGAGDQAAADGHEDGGQRTEGLDEPDNRG
jgi:hypothetical protein